MCKAADVAMTMVNESIRLAEETRDVNYYMDFVKLHKLLYLGQCYMLGIHDRPLFEETVSAHQCGPNVENIHFVPAERGFGVIDTPFSEDDIVRPSLVRIDAIEWVLRNYGNKKTEFLVEYAKSTEPYKKVAAGITDTDKPTISTEDMKDWFSHLDK